jgi:sRNA-binding carbon storage regulator CsrA
VLTLRRRPGDRLDVGPLHLRVASISEERLYLDLETPSLSDTVTVSVVTVSTVDARIGVNAPAELRVYRNEVWDDMQAANTSAAGQWTAEELAALTTEPN